MTSDDHAAGIRDRAERLYYVSAIGIDVRDDLISRANTLANERDEARRERDAATARAEMVRPLVSAAINMHILEGSTDYPNGDPEVEAARRSFWDELFNLWDLHYDELDWLDGDLDGDTSDGSA